MSKNPRKPEAPPVTQTTLPAGDTPLPPKAMTVEPSSSSMKDEWIVLAYVLHNTSQRTMHSYARVRRILFDRGTGLLKLSLDDSHIAPDSILATHLKVPPFLAVAGGETATLELKVPRSLRRLEKAAAGEAPKLQIDNLEGFQSIELQIAYNDTPFYYKPGGASIGAQLQAWSRGMMAIAHSARDIGWQSKERVR